MTRRREPFVAEPFVAEPFVAEPFVASHHNIYSQ